MYFITRLYKILYDLVTNSQNYLNIESKPNQKEENLNSDLQEQISDNSYA